MFGNYLHSFISLIYPNVCMACGNCLFKQESRICTFCIYHLPKTNFHKFPENPVHKLFWGRVDVKRACAYYYFNKGGRVQHLMHNLKYNGQKEVGHKVGQLFGQELKQVPVYAGIDLVIPVPLHLQKLNKRGYNQSEWFAKGLSDSLEITCDSSNLVRENATSTQTRKNKYDRWKNVESVFKVRDPEALENKKILLVDDVITTGATLEACANKLLQSKGVEVYIAAIASA